MKNFVVKVLCVCMLTSSYSPFAPLTAYANENDRIDQNENIEEIENISVKEKSKETKNNVEVVKIPEGHAYIPKDTVLNMELQTTISSKTAQVGDIVPLIMTDNIIINDVVVIQKGTTVNAKVTKATSSGLFGRAGKLEFMIDSVETVNGVKVPLQYTTKKEAGSDDGAIAVAALSFVTAAFAAIAVAAAVTVIGGLFMKGKNVSFPVGSKFAAKVVNDTDLNATLDNLADVMNPDKPHGVTIVLKK